LRLTYGVILAVESSCDESALATFDPARGILREAVSSQAAAHEKYGGVVPDLASRMHLSALPLLMEEFRADLPSVDRIAVTRGPGLLPCLSLGLAFARAVAMATGRPLSGVNHLRAHVHSPFIGLHAADPAGFTAARAALLPHLAAVVSGGNSLLVELGTDLRMKVLARTVDDAAGEAFDKGAKLLGLPYPGGALIERLAAQGDASRHPFPRGIPEKSDLRMSFSGLKTALRYQLETLSDQALKEQLPHICAGYQKAIVEQLVAKTESALGLRHFRSLGLSGGVANNAALRTAFAATARAHGVRLLTAEPRHCGDNAGMIAFAAWADVGLPADDAVAPAAQLAVEET
jgi:N6-L-threonylcarbamoyladenine synthase